MNIQPALFDLADPAPSSSTLDPEAYALECLLRSHIISASLTAPRSQQSLVGASEIGNPCDRALAYKLNHSAVSNVEPDPLRSLVGTGIHLMLAALFRDVDKYSGRFLVEQHLYYRGIPGTCDLFDRKTHTVVDWKSTTKNKIKRLRYDGPPSSYVTQIQTYGAALESIGERPQFVSLAYVPIDSTLDDMWVWRTPYNRAVADQAIDRLFGIQTTLDSASSIADIEPHPSNLCAYCDFYLPHSADENAACPGNTERTVP